MFIALCLLAVAAVTTETSSLAASPVAKASAPSRDAAAWTPENVDDAWAEKVLADPEYDRGWLQSCQDDWNDGGAAVCEVRELSDHAAAGSPIAIHGGENGGMTVIGWDRSDSRVIYRVKARAKTEAEARELAKQVSLELRNGWIRPKGPESTRGRWWSVEVKAWVPRSSDLSLSTRNGPIGVRHVSGTMDLQSVNGPVALIDLGGAVSARAQNGPLHVELTGTQWSGKGLDAEAQNGPLNLVVPRNYSARLQTGTINGPSSIDYPLDIQGRLRGHFSVTLGAGGPVVRAVTDNGPFNFTER
jgi:hypothetical protein